MFKKTLLALALTGLAGTATAATITNTSATYSVEGTQFLTEIDLAALNITAGSSTAYQEGDKVVISFPNDNFAVGTSAALSAALVSSSAVSVVAATGNANAYDALGTTDKATVDALVATAMTNAASAIELNAGSVVYSGGNTVSFTLGSTTANVKGQRTVTVNDATLGDYVVTIPAVQLTLSGIKLSAANLKAGGKVDATYQVTSAVTNGGYDKETATTVATVAEQFKVEAGTPVLDAKVDVSNDRKVFENAGLSDKLQINATNNGGSNAATVKSVVYTVNGDFSFLDTDADDKADYAVTSTAGTVAIAKDFQKITVTSTGNSVPDAEITIEATDGTTVIPTQSFTVEADVKYTATGAPADQTKSFTFSGGAWKLNGYQDKVSFLPFGSQYAQSVTVTNRGTVEGAITVELTANGEVETKKLTAVALKNSVTDISKEVAAFAAELGINGNASVNIIVDAPEANISTDAVYYAKADKDRVKTK